MRINLSFVIGSILLLAVGLLPIWSQDGSETAPFAGSITRNKEPVAGAQVILTNPANGKQYKTKTDRKGEYVIMGVAVGTYKIVVIGSAREILYLNNGHVIDGQRFPVDVSNPQASGGVASQVDNHQNRAKERMADENAKVASLNALLVQAQNAMQSQKWNDAEIYLQRVFEAYPATTRWELYKAFGDVEVHLQKDKDAVLAYGKGIEVAQAVVLGTAPEDPRAPNHDPALAAAGLEQMLISQGNAYSRLNQLDEAVMSFKRAAEAIPNATLAYYDLCAVEFNSGKVDDAVAACDKSISASPSNADAWYLKGSVLYEAGKTKDAGAPLPGTVEALHKYLELDPHGAHAAEVNAILRALGQK